MLLYQQSYSILNRVLVQRVLSWMGQQWGLDVQLCVISITVEVDPISACDKTDRERVNDEDDWTKGWW